MSRRRIALAALFVVAAAAAAAAYAYAAPKRYDAVARVVVHPIPAADTTFTGIDVLRASGDTPRDLETAAHFFDTPEVISTTATRLSLLPSEVSRSLDVHPLAGSNILLVVGKSSTPGLAAQIANGIAQEAISERTARVQAQVAATLNRLRTSSSPEARRRAVDLQALQARPDPTLESLSAATAPTNAAWPKPVRLIAEATLAGLLLAVLFLLLSWLHASQRKPAPAAAPDPNLEDREQALARREAEIEQREHELQERPVPAAGADRKLADREQALTRRASAIDQRERELQQVIGDAKKATVGEQQHLERRIAAVTVRERAMAKQAAALAKRERELAKNEAALEKAARRQKVPEPAPVPEPEPEPVPEPEPEPTPAPRPPTQPFVRPRTGGWTIPVLEQLVEERGADHPERVDEWRYYVQFLSEHAAPDGTLPASFDFLIEETFAEAL